MLTRSRMCGLAAAIGAVLCLSAMRAGFAQEILKELESAEPSQSQVIPVTAIIGARLLARRSRARPITSNTELISTPLRDRRKNRPRPGMSINMGCKDSSGHTRSHARAPARVGCQKRVRTTVCMPHTAIGRRCTTRFSTSFMTTKVGRAAVTRHSSTGCSWPWRSGRSEREFWGLRAMLSPDPFMGKNGYPLLFATGETADGKTTLVDRQHPHDLFMELATTFRYDFTKTSSAYLYAGLPGEPALGPSAFMHRTSGMDIPEAPITHHWLDSTHITFGVLTAGLVLNTIKIEGSVFRGREPDQYRFDIEAPKLDSYSARVSWNPTRELSFQASWGHLKSPEQLEPEKNEDRFTVSAIYTQPFGKNNIWSTTLAWGRKMMKPGDTLDGLILETAAIFDRTYTIFARAERVQENELLDHSGPVVTVNKLTVGGIYDFYSVRNTKFGIGSLVSFYGIPGDLRPVYGDPVSGMVFARFKVE